MSRTLFVRPSRRTCRQDRFASKRSCPKKPARRPIGLFFFFFASSSSSRSVSEASEPFARADIALNGDAILVMSDVAEPSRACFLINAAPSRDHASHKSSMRAALFNSLSASVASTDARSTRNSATFAFDGSGNP